MASVSACGACLGVTVEGALCVTGLTACFAYIRGASGPKIPDVLDMNKLQLEKELHRAHMTLAQIHAPNLGVGAAARAAAAKVHNTALYGEEKLRAEVKLARSKLKSMPTFHAPDLHMPDVKMPDVHMPHVSAPTLPTFHPPNLHAPNITMPTYHAPDLHMRDLHMPGITAPTIHVPNIHGPHMPDPEAHAAKVAAWGQMKVKELREELHKAHVHLTTLLHPHVDPKKASDEATRKVEEVESEAGLRQCLSDTHKKIDIQVVAPDARVDQFEVQNYQALKQKLQNIRMQCDMLSYNPDQLAKELAQKDARVQDLQQRMMDVDTSKPEIRDRIATAEPTINKYRELTDIKKNNLGQLSESANQSRERFDKVRQSIQEAEKLEKQVDECLTAIETSDTTRKAGRYNGPQEVQAAGDRLNALCLRVQELELKVLSIEKANATFQGHSPFHPAVEALRQMSFTKPDLQKQLHHAHTLLGEHLRKAAPSEFLTEKAHAAAFKTMDVAQLGKRQLREELSRTHEHIAHLKSKAEEFIRPYMPRPYGDVSTATLPMPNSYVLARPTQSGYIIRFK